MSSEPNTQVKKKNMWFLSKYLEWNHTLIDKKIEGTLYCILKIYLKYEI